MSGHCAPSEKGAHTKGWHFSSSLGRGAGIADIGALLGPQKPEHHGAIYARQHGLSERAARGGFSAVVIPISGFGGLASSDAGPFTPLKPLLHTGGIHSSLGTHRSRHRSEFWTRTSEVVEQICEEIKGKSVRR